MKSNYPTKLLAWIQSRDGDISSEPDYSFIFYTERETNAFLEHLRKGKHSIRIEEHKPRLRELTRLNIFEKMSYMIPFKTQISDILVDIVKLIIGFILGYFTKQIML